MTQRIGTKAGELVAKPLKPAVTVAILCLVLSLSGAIVAAYWNGAKWMEKPFESKSPYHGLKLRDLILDTNYSLHGIGVASLPGGGGNAPVPVSIYLPDNTKPTPIPVAIRLPVNLTDALREVAIAKIEQGGMPVPDIPPPTDPYVRDPANPSLLVPAPDPAKFPGNGFLKLYFEVNRDTERNDAVRFKITCELWRDVYYSRDESIPIPRKVEERSVGPLRVLEKNLETALMSNVEKLIDEQVVQGYRIGNPDTKSR